MSRYHINRNALNYKNIPILTHFMTFQLFIVQLEKLTADAAGVSNKQMVVCSRKTAFVAVCYVNNVKNNKTHNNTSLSFSVILLAITTLIQAECQSEFHYNIVCLVLLSLILFYCGVYVPFVATFQPFGFKHFIFSHLRRENLYHISNQYSNLLAKYKVSK